MRGLISGVATGAISRDVGGVLIQAYNLLLRVCEHERKAREQDELERRLERLEENDRVGDPWP